MYLMRRVLIATVVVFTGAMAVVVCRAPYGWLGLFLLAAGFCRRAARLHAYGTSRWADSSDMKGMIDD